MTIDGKEVVFFRPDGTRATNSVAKGGVTEDGELIFFEIKDSLRPILDGKNKYQRVVIGRVFPCVKVEEENDKEE